MKISLLTAIINQSQPQQLALFVNGQAYSYDFLINAAKSVAQWLCTEKIETLGIVADRSLGNYVAIMACLFAGKTYVPLHPSWPPQHILEIKQQLDLDVIFAAEQFDFNTKVGSTFFPVEFNLKKTAYILFTSGSTGKPKGICVSYGNLQAFVSAMQARHQLKPSDRVAQHADLTFDMSVYDVFMSWHAGACLYVVPEAERLAPLKFIAKNNISVWFSVPSVIRILHKLKLLKPNALPSLRLSLFSGDVLTHQDALHWQCAASNSDIDNLYGPTEATVEVLAYRFAAHNCGVALQESLPLGEPISGNLLALCDEQDHWLTQGAGELLIGGEQVAQQYLHNPTLTADKFITRAHPQYGLQRWYRSGDWVRCDEKGRYYFLGRVDNQIKIRGRRMECEAIESALKALIAGEVVVFAQQRAAESEKILVAVTTQQAINAQQVNQQLALTLPFYMIPEQYHYLPSLPLNARGKIDRQALAKVLA